MKKISIENCLDSIPNKFELTVLAMNRAKELLMGATSSLKDDKYAKKPVNQALFEIQGKIIDLDALRDKVKYNITNNNLFLKEVKSFNDNEIDNESDAISDADIDFEFKDEEENDDDFDLSVSDESVNDDDE